MKMTKAKTLLSAIASAAILSACGGGGGDSSTPPVNSNPPAANTSNVKLADATNNFSNVKTAYAATSYAGQNVFTLYQFLLEDVLLAANTSTAGTQTLSCPSGGSLTLTLTDADNSKSVTTGDTANVTFNSCQDTLSSTTMTLTGAASFAVKSATGTVGATSSDWTLTVDETASQFKATAGGASALINGTMTLKTQYTASDRTSYISATSSNVTAAHTSASGNVITVGMPNFTINDLYSANSGTDTVSLNGMLSVLFNKGASQLYLTVATPTNLVASNGAVSSGSVSLTSGTENSLATYAGANAISISGAATVQTSPSELNAILTN
ncbi:hypothetical protein [Burkholderia cenocepacia]|uniref:hypothetical protein n=1 Tax=Burkholderia cenocepacia TaxID=95486 RepID=UPI0007614384|nr:hypothetical protein [Burkholderia cenocepacia]KWU17910.1 hypothetical protein AS149_14640 [Burkholderia cenocepacia]